MKKLLFISGCFVVLSASYSFSKMEGLYSGKIPGGDQGVDVLLTYNLHINYVISVLSLRPARDNFRNFLTVNFDYNIGFWTDSKPINFLNYGTPICFIYDRYNFCLQKNESLTEKSKSSYLEHWKAVFDKILKYSASNDYYYSTSLDPREGFLSSDFGVIKFRKEFDCEGVRVENRADGVTLNQNGKPVDLQEALKKYYGGNIHSDFAQALKQVDLNNRDEVNRPYLDSKLVVQMTTLNHPQLSDESLGLLNSCKILALWYVIPEEVEYINKVGEVVKKKVYFKLFGLAEDDKGKKFHWMADLNNNLSALMQYGHGFDWTIDLNSELSLLMQN